MPRNCLEIGPKLQFPTHSVKQGSVAKEARNKNIFGLWLPCYTLGEIADKVDLTQNADKEILNKSAELPKFL